MTVRPPLGFPLPELVTVASRVITGEAGALRAALDDFSNAPQPGCPWNQDDKTVSDHASPHVEGQGKLLLNARHQAMLIYVNASDILAHRAAPDRQAHPSSDGPELGNYGVTDNSQL